MKSTVVLWDASRLFPPFFSIHTKEVRMSKAKKLLLLLVVLLLATTLVLTSCKGGKAGNVIKIGYTAPFTASAAHVGTNGWRGVQLALGGSNAAGGRGGNK